MALRHEGRYKRIGAAEFRRERMSFEVRIDIYDDETSRKLLGSEWIDIPMIHARPVFAHLYPLLKETPKYKDGHSA